MPRKFVEKIIRVVIEEPATAVTHFPLWDPKRAGTFIAAKGHIQLSKDVGDDSIIVAAIQVERNGSVGWSDITASELNPRQVQDVLFHCMMETGKAAVDPVFNFAVDCRSKRKLESEDRVVLSIMTDINNSAGNIVALLSIFFIE